MFVPGMMTYRPQPRVLLSIDYEPWFALTRRFDRIDSSAERFSLEGGFCGAAADAILDLMGPAKASFFMVGEVVDWYPEIPEKITAAGHELGFHCQRHRSLVKFEDLEQDLDQSKGWREQWRVRGYRAPMVGIPAEGYRLLAQHGFIFSSSIYAPAGSLFRNSGVWEIPVSTWKFAGRMPAIQAPRQMTASLLACGELPFGSSLMSGISKSGVLRLIEGALRQGSSPVIFLHPYELVSPEDWPGRIRRDLLKNPFLFPFTMNKAGFLKQVLTSFPVSPLGAWLDEVMENKKEDD